MHMHKSVLDILKICFLQAIWYNTFTIESKAFARLDDKAELESRPRSRSPKWDTEVEL